MFLSDVIIYFKYKKEIFWRMCMLLFSNNISAIKTTKNTLKVINLTFMHYFPYALIPYAQI